MLPCLLVSSTLHLLLFICLLQSGCSVILRALPRCLWNWVLIHCRILLLSLISPWKM
ncbi:hypothetical protein EV361DRAFT_933425 [Lentinula raphanica]|nr:hypothetical protein EV361DRAFT_933425 [Lentinula raphanica]